VIDVVLVEEMRLLRGALAALLEQDTDIKVVDGIGWNSPIISRAAELRPGVVVINTDVIGQAVSTAVMVEKTVPCPCLILFDPRKPVLLSAETGARPPSFVAQDAPPDVLAKAVRRVANGELVMDPRVVSATLMVGESPLTRRELEVLALTADGVPVSEIADRLTLSPGTVRNYLSAVVAKTKARNRIDAIRISHAEGWL
jgi:two-component system, NarL family, response regulator DesR